MLAGVKEQIKGKIEELDSSVLAIKAPFMEKISKEIENPDRMIEISNEVLFEEAEKLSREGLKIAEKLGERGKRGVAQALDLLGNIQHDIGNARQAIEYYEQALAIDKEVYGDRHPNVARTLNNIGLAWDALGDSQHAKEYFQQTYSIFRELYGDEHPHTIALKDWRDRLK